MRVIVSHTHFFSFFFFLEFCHFSIYSSVLQINTNPAVYGIRTGLALLVLVLILLSFGCVYNGSYIYIYTKRSAVFFFSSASSHRLKTQSSGKKKKVCVVCVRVRVSCFIRRRGSSNLNGGANTGKLPRY